MLQINLDDVRNIWNTHRLQSHDKNDGGGQRPMMLYNLPHLYGTTDHLCRVEDDEVQICEEETTPKVSCGDETVSELCSLFMEENHISTQSIVIEANELYKRLREMIRFELE